MKYIDILLFTFCSIIFIHGQSKDEWFHFDTTNSILPSDWVNCIVVDSNNIKWIGMECSGLLILEHDTSYFYNKNNSDLIINNVGDITIDHFGNKWISYSRGVGFSVFRKGGVVFTSLNDHKNNNDNIVFRLEQNYPNPFNLTTTIKYSIPENNNVKIKIFNILGEEIITLLNEYKSAGKYEVEFDGSGLSSGIYFYILLYDDYLVDTKKFILLK